MLNEQLPSGVYIETDEEGLTIRVDGEVAQRVDYSLLEGSDPEGTLQLLLSGLQNLVIRYTGQRWPSDALADCESGAGLLLPRVSIDESSARVWFSGDDVEVREIALVPLSESH